MATTFLRAEWRNLLMANYEVDPAILQKHVPCRTELDTFNGKHFVSLVGFLFKNTKVLGIGFPFHKTFEEVNLRFYVRYKENNQWKRGVVFMKEMVPRRMITFVANKLYGEKYATHQMRHLWKKTEEELFVSYEWKAGSEWNYLKAAAAASAEEIKSASVEEFITEHYWGYTTINDDCTGVYQVDHPKWRVHAVKNYEVYCSAALLYGKEFEPALQQPPHSVLLAEGSPISVFKGQKIYR